MNTKYLLGSLLTIPLLPVMYIQSRQIRARVPRLPAAKGPEGVAGVNSDQGLQIISVGESTIAGVGIETHEEGFTATVARTLAEKLKAEVAWKVYAKSGFNAKDVKEKIIPRITESEADLVVVGLGGNDAFELNSPGKWRKQIQELLKAIRVKFPDAPIVFANMPPIREFPAFTSLIRFVLGNLVDLLGEELEDLIQDQPGVYFYSRKISFDSWMVRLNLQADPSEFFSDGVHPSRLTYQTWGRDFANFILENAEVKKTLAQKMN